MKLLSQVETGPAFVEHLDDATKVALGSLQAFDYFPMGFVKMSVCHATRYPWRDIAMAPLSSDAGVCCRKRDRNLQPDLRNHLMIELLRPHPDGGKRHAHSCSHHHVIGLDPLPRIRPAGRKLSHLYAANGSEVRTAGAASRSETRSNSCSG